MKKTYPVFPGASLSLVEQTGATAPKEHSHLHPQAAALEINYCSSGRLGWHMQNNTTVYLGNGDLSINALSCCFNSSMDFPLGHYTGIQVILDFDILLENPPSVWTDLKPDRAALKRQLAYFKMPLSLPSSPEIQQIFKGLSLVPEKLRLPYYRLKIQELLFFLLTSDFSQKKEVNPYQSQQAELMKTIHEYLTQNLDRRITIDALSQKYLVNTSTLKEVFKGVYGQPIASYMKEYRIRHAMELLRTTDSSIADIARQIGYESQSKFSSAFREYAGVLPTEYRKINAAPPVAFND